MEAVSLLQKADSADIGARIDRLPATRYLWSLVALVSFGGFFEIYDLGLSAPLGLGLQVSGIFHKGTAGIFGLSDQATFVALTFAGLYIGTFGFSTFADRLGRRPAFTFSLLWYAGATVVMGFQTSAVPLMLWRFIASIGVGVELVAIDCYLAELMPKTLRGRAFAVSGFIQFLSLPFVSVLAWQLIPGSHFGVAGWRWLTFLPVIGAVLVWWVRRGLPESPRWLSRKGRAAAAETVVSRIEAHVREELGRPLPPAVAGRAPEPAQPQASSISVLLRPPYRRRTLALVVFHLVQTIGFFGFSNWLPILLVSQGVTISKSLGYSAFLAVIPPAVPLLFSAFFADRFERKWLVVCGATLAALSGLLLSRMTAHTNALVFIATAAGVASGNSLMSVSYHTYQSEVFPTQVRAFGVGFVYSFSRLSAIFSGYIIAFTLDKAGANAVFVLISGAMATAALSIGLFGPRTRGRALEEI
ncbi:MAG TPA: MFS transporter [Rhizomicrobium sp.]|nr:MFS transporter [Rhizomicrobium sp.]